MASPLTLAGYEASFNITFGPLFDLPRKPATNYIDVPAPSKVPEFLKNLHCGSETKHM
jgi:hypothetical protein